MPSPKQPGSKPSPDRANPLRISILPGHFAIVAEILIHFAFTFLNGHAMRLCSHCHDNPIAILDFIIHGALVVAKRRLAIFVLPIGVEKDAESLHANATKDAKDIALVLAKLWWGFATEDEEVVAEKGLDAGQTEVGKTGAVVEECVNALKREVGAVAEMDSLEHANGYGPVGADLFRLRKGPDAAICNGGALDQADSLELWQRR